jgi:hypothetical protein
MKNFKISFALIALHFLILTPNLLAQYDEDNNAVHSADVFSDYEASDDAPAIVPPVVSQDADDSIPTPFAAGDDSYAPETSGSYEDTSYDY